MPFSFSDTFLSLIFIVSFIVTVLYLSTRTQLFVNIILKKERSAGSTGILIMLGGALEVIASEFGVPFPEGVMADVRIPITILFGMIGGPAVGIPVGLIGGAYRMSGLFWQGFNGTLGYTFAVAGGLATIGAGLLGSILYRKGIALNGRGKRDLAYILIVTFLWLLIDIELICPLTAPIFSEMSFTESFYVSNRTILLPMVFSNLFAIVVFSLLLRNIVMEEKKKVVLQKLVKKYEELIGPVAGRIAKETAKEEDYPLEYLKEK
jgi:LytS/YehU family sensor histidine kinase